MLLGLLASNFSLLALLNPARGFERRKEAGLGVFPAFFEAAEGLDDFRETSVADGDVRATFCPRYLEERLAWRVFRAFTAHMPFC